MDARALTLTPVSFITVWNRHLIDDFVKSPISALCAISGDIAAYALYTCTYDKYAQFFKNRASLDLALFTKPSDCDFYETILIDRMKNEGIQDYRV